MTAPEVALVDGRGWPIVEQILVEAFTELVDVGVPVYVGTVTQPEQQWPAIRVQRLPGGGKDANRVNDRSRIEVVTFGTSYPQSAALTEQVRTIMGDLDNGEFRDVGLDRITEEAGPGRIPDPNQDLRAVPTTWTVVTRQQ